MTDTATFVSNPPLLALYPTPPAFSRSIKAFFNGEIRRFSFVGSSFNELVGELCHLGIPAHSASVCYQDDEGDWVTISSDVELFHAFELFGNRPIRLDIRPKGTPAIAPSVAPGTPVSRGSPSTPRVENKEQFKALKKQVKIEEKLARRDLKESKKDLKESRKGYKLEAKLAKKELKKEFKSYVKDQVKPPKLVARFVKHVTVEDGYEFLPGTQFTKTWRLRNEGTIPWPANCTLIFVGKRGDQLGAPNSVLIDRIVLPGEEVDVSVAMTAPADAGTYFGYWKMAEPTGKKFGQRIRVLIKVIDSSSSSSSEEREAPREVSNWGAMLTQLESMGFKDKGLNVKLLVKCRGDLDRVVVKLLRREERKSGVKRGTN